MSIRKLREMPKSGEAFPGTPVAPTPQCESNVQVVGNHAKRWRQRDLGDRWLQCSRPSTVQLDGVNLCRRHAGERVLEQYLAGELIRKDT